MILITLTSLTDRGESLLRGRRVLLVEDDYLVGIGIRGMLERMGCEVLGPIATVDQARELIEDEPPDIGVLDINIVGGTSAPIAEMLNQRQRPFFFVTGYQSPSHLLPELLRQTRRLEKPVDEQSLARAMSEAFG